MRQALGKGIGALIPSAPSRRAAVLGGPEEEAVPPGARIEEIPVGAIEANPRQPRTRFEEAALEDLARSIAEQGVLQPILVRPLPEGRFELIAGERRLRASRRAGRATIPAVIRRSGDDESLLLAIIENVQRSDLNAIEEALAYRALNEEFGLTQEEVARRVGKTRPAVANALRLLQLPEKIQGDIRSGVLSAGHARAVLAVEGDAARENLAREIVTRGLNVREAEEVASRASAAPTREAAPDPDVARLAQDLSRIFGTKVSIHTGRGGKGRVELQFYSDDDLARLGDQLLRRGRSSMAHTAR
ncbi:MAG: ParB/RepB/Spo0J family partition protein [Deltaproteobacteria bacterium]|nr:ParB/RepB/Spo0J family partition protein [Deltaproteobacteria bacterium]